MSSLGSTYLTINNNALHETSSFDMEPQVVEKVFQTEDGHDQTILVRTGKYKYKAAWEGAPDTLRLLLETFNAASTVSVLFEGTTRTMRARNLSAHLVRYSNRYSESSGLWDLSIDLEEI